MTYLEIVWIGLQIIIGYNLVLPFLLFLFWKLFGKKKNSPEVKINTPGREADYAIIVTAYEQTDSLGPAISSLLNLHYKNYMIYVVADKCDISSLHFEDEKVVLLRPPTTLASNTDSHSYAIEHFQRPHERITIIDSDNVVDSSYLEELNCLFKKGYEAVQGIREAKNLNNAIACLDAARDIYYHFYDGKVLFELGSSATLSGSGMAFEASLYTRFLATKKIKGAGFDKVLQAFIVGQNKRIAFTDKAVVFDEKTSRSDQLVNQRSRWINTWFKYFGFGFTILFRGVINGSINQLLFGFILLRPPLFLFILLSLACMVINLGIMPSAIFVWSGAFLLFIAGFMISLFQLNADKRIFSSLVNIPKFIMLQIASLLKVRRANTRSVATRHYHVHELEQRDENGSGNSQ